MNSSSTNVILDVSPVCRICLMEGTDLHRIHKRCNCASYHDDCFKDWVRHRRLEYCEVCESPYIGVRRQEREIIVANLQRQATAWLVVYAVTIAMVWILKGLIESYSDCVFSAQHPKRTCTGWNDIEELLIVIVGIGTPALCFQAVSISICPREAGLIITTSNSDFVIIPGTTNRSRSNPQPISVLRI